MPEQWDVVDTTTGIVVFETRNRWSRSGADIAEEARAEWEMQPDDLDGITTGTPGWDE